MSKKLYILLSFIFLYISLLAQTSFYVQAPSVAFVGETFQVKYILTNPKSHNPRFIRPANVPGLDYYSTSNFMSQSSSITIINGHLKSVSKKTITWIITYVPTKPGNITIPPAKVIDGNKQYSTNPVTIEVQANANNNLPKPTYQKWQQQQMQSLQQQMQSWESQLFPSNSGQDLFLRVFVSKKDVYQGQPVYVYTKIFSRYRLSIDDYSPSKFTGFWVQEMKMPANIQAKQEVINGRTYLTAVIDKRVVFPQEVGKLEITPSQITCTLYDDMGFPYGQKTIKSNAVYIHVRPLPKAGQPQDFSGAVGKFQMQVKLSSDKLNVDRPLTVKVYISGVGNFGLFDLPEVNAPKSFESLQSSTIPQYNVSPEGLVGRVIKQFIFIPRAAGKFTIQPVSFSYFDPQTKKYVTLTSKPLTVTVTSTSDTTAVAASYGSYGSAVKQLGSDIDYIYTSGFKLHKKTKFFAGSAAHWLSYLILLLIFILVVYLERKKIKQRADVKTFRAKRASKVSLKRLQQAYRFMKENRKEKFYEEVTKALWGYISDKLSIDPAQLTRENVEEKLTEKGVDKELIAEFEDLLDKCETARYANLKVDFSMQDVYNKARKLIEKFEQRL